LLDKKPIFIQTLSMSQPYQKFISDNIDYILQETNLDLLNRRVGKVRDSYTLEDSIVLITTDRQSAFDRNLASIPFKGAILNLISAYWFDLTKDIIPNHVILVPHPNVTIAKKVKIFPVEFVVRGYLTGSTSTSAWVNYNNGIRDFCGNILPEGMVKNQKFTSPIVTPTTKSEQHDELISGQEIVKQGLMSQQDWDFVSAKALELFKFASVKSSEHGLILVDTKLEFGKLEDGTIVVADEMFTPDSSRYWIADTFKERFAEGREPENIDKEFLRLWFIANCDPYKAKVLPTAPKELVVELSGRYIQLYEMITNHNFPFPDVRVGVEEGIKKVLKDSDLE
jgi:phosphoribosylaminoimidazole-succinocarboxamide synthase